MGVETAALEVAALEVAALEVAALHPSSSSSSLSDHGLRSATSSTLVGSRGWETGMEVLEDIWRFMGEASRQCVSQRDLDRSINEVHNQ